MDEVLKWLYSDGLIAAGVLIVAVLARHFGGHVISQIIRHVVRRTKFNAMSDDDVTKRQETLISLLSVVWKIFIILITVLILIKVFFGNVVDLTPLFASAGIVGVALGFGAQSLVKDFLSGIFIISENQYRVGDVVDIEGAAGSVEKVGIRSTILRDVDGNVHFIPNGSIIHVINKTMGYSKVNFTLSVDPETDIDKLAKVIDETGKKMAIEENWKEKVLEPPHFINIGAFSEIGMEVIISGKTSPSAQWGVTGELRRRLLRAFRKHNIELAQAPTMPLLQAKRR